MARFLGEYAEVFTVRAPLEQAAAHFGNLDAIARNYGTLERFDRVDAQTLHLVLLPRSEKGITFKGEYTCRYVYPSPNVLEWSTVTTRNLWSQGRATFASAGPGLTRVDYRQRMEAEMEVNRLLAAVAAPIVSHQIRDGVRSYLLRMTRDLESIAACSA